jgi:N4-gp56 family major capsid protein
MTAAEWYSWDAAGLRTTHATKAAAVAASTPPGGTDVRFQSGDGNLYGSDKDMATQKGAFPVLAEEGGMLNRVGMKRETLEADVIEYGFYLSFTKRSLEMDTEKGLLSRYVTELGVAQGDVRESQIRTSVITASETNRTFAGNAVSMDDVNELDTLDFPDLRLMDQALNAALCPYDTKIIDGSTKVDTKTVAAARYVYIGPQLRPTVEDITHGGRDMWIPVEMYAAAGNIAQGEIGKIGQFRFIVDQEMNYYEGAGSDTDDAGGPIDPNFNSTNGHYDVFPVVFVGSGSFATVGFQGDVARVKTIMPKADAYNDVYGKRGAVSISWYFGFMVLRPEFLRQVVGSAKIA